MVKLKKEALYEGPMSEQEEDTAPTDEEVEIEMEEVVEYGTMIIHEDAIVEQKSTSETPAC